MRVETKITIKADIDRVWQVITMTQDYSLWNPFIIDVESSQIPPKLGAEMKFKLRWQDDSNGNSREIVSSFTPPRKVKAGQKAEWSYSFKSFLSTIGMVKAKRFHVLRSEKEGETFYHTFEDFKGWGVRFLPLGKIQDGFERQTKALRTYCESETSK